MEHKFRREDHARQDKAKKPDYREDLIEESLAKSSPAHLEKFKKNLTLRKRIMELLKRASQTVNDSEEIRKHKEGLILNYYDGTFSLGGRDFRFRWSFKEYVNYNKVDEFRSQTYKRPQPLWGCMPSTYVSQGSSFLATLGFGAESLRDSSIENYSLPFIPLPLSPPPDYA
jgi:hypothetical protein